MRRQSILVLGCVAACVLPATVHAQATLPSGGGALDALVHEIRLLRQAFEKQGATTARVQLVIGQLTLQDQRTARARQVVERLESELTAAETEGDRLQTAVRELVRSVEQVTDDGRRQQLENDVRMVRARLADTRAGISRTEARLSQARQALDAEAGRYDELETWLRDLDKQLQGGG